MISLSVIRTLNTMFKENANTVFNNAAFNCAMIRRMTNKRKQEKDMHPQMQRLYRAARELLGMEKPADVARYLDLTQANLTNWGSRGIPVDKFLMLQEKLGCDAIWLRDGVGHMIRGTAGDAAQLNGFLEISTLYWKADQDLRQKILDAVRTLAKHRSKL